MQAMMETTKWNVDFACSHLYWMDGDNALAYCKGGKGKPIYFKEPIRLDMRGRKFVEVRKHPFTGETRSTIVKVNGSKGDVYEVDVEANTCTCPAFRFRKGQCKHLAQVKGMTK